MQVTPRGVVPRRWRLALMHMPWVLVILVVFLLLVAGGLYVGVRAAGGRATGGDSRRKNVDGPPA